MTLPDPGSVGSDLATCATHTPISGGTDYTDNTAPVMKSLQWRLRTPAVKVVPILDVPAAGVVAAIRGREVQRCSGADLLTSTPSARAVLAFAAPGAPAPYALTATDSTVSTNAVPFDQTVFGADRRWCPADAGHTSVASVTTRQRFSAFTLMDGTPLTLNRSTATPGVEAANPLVAPATSPLLRTKTRIVLTFSKTELRKGSTLTVFGQLQRLSTGPRPAPITATSACGPQRWLPLPNRVVTLSVAAANVKAKKQSDFWKVVQTIRVTTDSAGRVKVNLKPPALRQFTWKVAATALPTWLSPSASLPQFVFVD